MSKGNAGIIISVILIMLMILAVIFVYFKGVPKTQLSIIPDKQGFYDISLTAREPDSDYSDGTVSYQYGHWGLFKNDELIESDEEDVLNGKLSKIIDGKNGDKIYGAITEIDGVFDIDKEEWIYGEENIIASAFYDIKTGESGSTEAEEKATEEKEKSKEDKGLLGNLVDKAKTSNLSIGIIIFIFIIIVLFIIGGRK